MAKKGIVETLWRGNRKFPRHVCAELSRRPKIRLTEGTCIAARCSLLVYCQKNIKAFLVFVSWPLWYVRAGHAVWPNPAFSGHGYAVGQRRRFEGGVASPTVLLGKTRRAADAIVGRRAGEEAR